MRAQEEIGNMAQAAMWATPFRVPDWLPSDTEESVVGTEWHQEAIGALADMLREAARRHGASWGVCEQVALRVLSYENGHPYDPRPDVMVLARPLSSGNLSSVHLDDVGAPLFIAEVASDSTVGNDIGEKRRAYAAVGVREYLVFDPDGNLLSAPVLAWRLVSGAYVPSRPDPDGWWRSLSLDVAFHDAQPFLRVRDRDGREIELSRDVRQRAHDLEQRLSEAERRRAVLEEELERLRAQPPRDT